VSLRERICGIRERLNDNVENMVLEQLRAIRTEQAAARDREIEIIRRVSGVETMVARLGRDSAHAFAERVDNRHTIDQLRDRIDRVAGYLNLTN